MPTVRFVTPPLFPLVMAVLWTIILATAVARHDWTLCTAALTLVGLYGGEARRARRETHHILRPAFTASLIGCARCHGPGHERIGWMLLTYPIEDSDGTQWTHWAPCPTNGEPILHRTSPT